MLAGAGRGRPPPRKGAIRTGRVSSGDTPPFLVRKQCVLRRGFPAPPQISLTVRSSGESANGAHINSRAQKPVSKFRFHFPTSS